VALGWLGDGGSARGDAHEAMNLAGVRRLPMVFVLDNNGFAYSTPAHLEYGVTHLADRAAAYGFPGRVVDGTDVVAVYRAAQEAIERARGGGGPTLLELVTLRMDGHAVHDDAFYVPPEVMAAWRERDPVALLRARLLAAGGTFDAEADDGLRSDVAREVDVAVELALASPWPDPDELTDGVYR
jgi:TPP-dependent pyruvate/acetoin dehydrogenase alpha subunit